VKQGTERGKGRPTKKPRLRDMKTWRYGDSTGNDSTARDGEEEMMLRPAVAGFTYAKLTPLLGWPGGL